MYWLAEQAVGQHGANQDGGELSMLLDVLACKTPFDQVLEVGSDQGGTLWLWAQIARQVVAITLHTRLDGSFNAHASHVIVGDSCDLATWQQAYNHVSGRPFDLVFIDGGHDAHTAWSDIQTAVKLYPAATVLVHDIARRENQPQIETWKAWAMAREAWPTVEITRQLGCTPGYGIIWPHAT